MTALEIMEAACAVAGGKPSVAVSDVRLGGDSSNLFPAHGATKADMLDRLVLDCW